MEGQGPQALLQLSLAVILPRPRMIKVCTRVGVIYYLAVKLYLTPTKCSFASGKLVLFRWKAYVIFTRIVSHELLMPKRLTMESSISG